MNADSVRGWAMSLSSGILLAIALLWMYPEMSHASGPFLAGAILLGALGALLAFDRYIYPVCPCCSHGNKRRIAEQPEMLWPLLAGIAIHNMFDGWTAAVATQTPGRAGIGLMIGVLIHKLPESVILGLLIRSATRRNREAFLWSIATSLFLLAGAVPYATSQMFQGRAALLISLTLGAASFLFIGIHTFRNAYSRSGSRFAIGTLLAGFACTAAVQVVLGLT